MYFAIVGNAAAVTQLVGNAAGLIRRIIQALRLSIIGEVLPGQPQDPELERPLKLVLACASWSAANQFFGARRHADSFRGVNSRIDSHLGLFPLVIYSAIASRLDRISPPDQACRLSIIGGVLPGLPQSPELERPLKLVLACASWSAANQFFGARRHADSFRGVNSRIDSHPCLGLFPLVIYSAIASRLDRISPPDQAGDPTPTAVPAPGSSSAPLQTQTVLPDDPRMFTWAELSAATNNFAIELAHGSSERVYKGRLHDGPEVVVKVLEKHDRQGKDDAFVAERYILFPLRHDNIVRLVGWCAEDEDRMFVYEHEHIRKGTLRDHLLRARSGSSSSPVTASWRARVEVLLGASRAIEHLHHRGIIHRDVSSSNIHLGASWVPRLSGFGTAVQATGKEHDGHPVEVVGTFGYTDPEYVRTKRVSPARDVYSFGVVMLEALTGRPPVSGSWEKGEDAVTLVDLALPAIRNEKLRDVLDGHPALQPTTPRQLEALKLVAHTARRCLWPHGNDRPAMSEVVDSLEMALGIIRSDEPDLLCYYEKGLSVKSRG